MKTINIMYNNLNQFKNKLLENNMNLEQEYFVIIHTSIFEPKAALKLAKNIKQIIPLAQIIGTSVSGIYYKGIQYEEGTLIRIHSFDFTSVKIKTFDTTNTKPEDIASTLYHSTKHINPKLHYLFCTNHYPKVSRFIESFNTYNTEAKLIGGISGDISQLDLLGYAFTDKEIIKEGIICASLSGFKLKTYIKPIVGHEIISKTCIINKTNGTTIEQINGTDALTWLKEQLGIDSFNNIDNWNDQIPNDILVKFPLILSNKNNSSRFIQYNSEYNRLETYFAEIDDNEEFKIGYLSPMKNIDECHEICEDLSSTPCESLFSYSCLFRKLYLNNISKWEMNPFKNFDISAVYMYGEIGELNGKNAFMHGSSTFICISEEEKYSEVNYSAFNDINIMQDASDEIIDNALEKLKQSKSSSTLLEKIVDKEKSMKMQVTIDANTGLKNISQLTVMNTNFDYNKLLIITIENGDRLLNHLSENEFHNIVRININNIKKYIENKYPLLAATFFSINAYTYAIASTVDTDKDLFLQITRDAFAHFEISYTYNNFICVNKFYAVVSNPYIESSIDTIINMNKYTSQRYVIYDGSYKASYISNDELRAITLLNKVSLYNDVEIQFDPIYDKNGNHTLSEIKFSAKSNKKLNSRIGRYQKIAQKYCIYNEITDKFLYENINVFLDKPEKLVLTLSITMLEDEKSFNKLINFYQKYNLQKKLFLVIECDDKPKIYESLPLICSIFRDNDINFSISKFTMNNNNFFKVIKLKPNCLNVDATFLETTDVDDQIYYKNLIHVLKEANIKIYFSNLNLNQLYLVEKYGADYYSELY